MRNATSQDGEATATYLVTGKILGDTGKPIGGVLVEAVDVRNSDEIVRLGSTAVESSGAFQLPLPVVGDTASRGLDLQLLVYAPEQPGVARTKQLLFQSEIRENAAPREYFLIEIIQKGNSSATGTTAKSGGKQKATISERSARIEQADDATIATKLKEVTKRRETFRKKIRPILEKGLSTVTDEERKRGRYVDDPAKISEIGIDLVKRDVEVLLGTRTPDIGKKKSARRQVRWHLTKDELAKLPGGGANAVTASEKDLEKLLGYSLDKPAGMFRREIFDDPCRPRTTAELCMAGEDHHHDEDDDHEENGTENTAEGTSGTETEHESGEPENPSAEIIAAYSSKEAIDRLMERQATPEDRLVYGDRVQPVTDVELEPVLTADKMTGALAALTFAPGPAEVPALHYFNDLQVAFEPIWQEALDDRFLNNVEAAYDQIVDRGGAPAADHVHTLFTDVFSPGHFLSELLGIGEAFEASYDNITSFIIVTREEWNALPKPARSYLKGIAEAMKELREDLLDSIDADDGFDLPLLGTIPLSIATNASFLPFLKPDTIEIRTKLQLLKADAEAIISLARRLILEAEATRPFRPTHSIIEDLKTQHQKAYPFRHFAASPVHRSVNFGLLVTYKQIWTLKAYQVGELVSTMPLAPDEERKYQRRTLRKTKRSVQEAESRFERSTTESQNTSRIETEIVNRASTKTNFSLSATGTVNFGGGGSGGAGGAQGAGGGMGFSASATSTFTRDVEKHSSAVKKEFNEAIRKATDEVKNERKTEILSEDISEDEVTQSGVVKNPNNQITCTYLFYELQRRIGIEEKLHGLQSVVFVAMEVPAPSELTYTWLIRHDWILSRVLLDPSFGPALAYVSTTMISDDVALREMRDALFRQRKLVEELKQDLAERRALSGLRYGALQKQIERTAKSSDGGGGFLGGLVGGVGDLVGGVPIVGDIVEGALDMVTGEGEVSQADQLREGASRDAYERESRDEQDIASRVSAAISTLESMQNDYTDRLSRHLAQLGQVHRLIDHIWQNILYYMQAIWSHMPQDQLFLMLKDVPVPVFEKDKSRPITLNPAMYDNVADISAINTNLVFADGGLATPPPPEKIDTKPLYQVANIYEPLGAWCNYLAFPMFEANPITELMMDPYIKLAEGEYGLSDPDPAGNMTLEEFADYVCCLKKHYEENDQADAFEKRKSDLSATLKKLLQTSRREEDIVIPCENGLYIEALPGTHSVMEQYKQLHRIIDVKSAQEDLRIKGLNAIRRAEMILKNELADPDIESVKNVYYHGAAPHDGDE